MTGATDPRPVLPRDAVEGQRLDAAALEQRLDANLRRTATREQWKYTPIGAFVDAMRALAPSRDDAPSLDGAPSFEGGTQPGLRVRAFADLDPAARIEIARQFIAGLDTDRHPLADLALLHSGNRSGNTEPDNARPGNFLPDDSFPGNAWLIDAEGPVPETLTIRYHRSGIVPVFVRLAAGASLTLVERVEATDFVDTRAFTGQLTRVTLARDATLHHYRAALDADIAHWSALQVNAAAGARYHLNQCYTGGARRRVETQIILEGQGASAELSGAYLIESGQHLDQQLVLEHRAPDTVSRQQFHGIGNGKGRSVFNGRIHIHPHCPRSDARLSNRNLALHPDAEMNTKPELEIYTDEVRCAHGATVGQLGADSLFFLASRGIAEADAKKLLCQGFLRECIEGPLSETITLRLLAALE